MRGSVARVIRHVGGSDRGTKPLPNQPAGNPDVQLPVLRGENAHRCVGWVVVARLTGHILVDQPSRRLEVEHMDHCLEQ
jgi:hypothetical protein